MKKEKSKIMLWAVVALVVGIVLGMLITNLRTTGNTLKIFKSKEISLEEYKKLVDAGIIINKKISENTFEEIIPDYISIRMSKKDRIASRSWNCCELSKNYTGDGSGSTYDCGDENCSIIK